MFAAALVTLTDQTWKQLKFLLDDSVPGLSFQQQGIQVFPWEAAPQHLRKPPTGGEDPVP